VGLYDRKASLREGDILSTRDSTFGESGENEKKLYQQNRNFYKVGLRKSADPGKHLKQETPGTCSMTKGWEI